MTLSNCFEEGEQTKRSGWALIATDSSTHNVSSDNYRVKEKD